MSSQRSTDVEPHGEAGPPAPGDPIPDPGLPPKKRYRLTDTDPRAARRAERQVATLFGLAALGVVAFCVAYFALPLDFDDAVGSTQWSNLGLGLSLGISLLAVGVGTILWAKKLMPDRELVQQRHPMPASPETRAAVVDDFRAGVEESGFSRRTLIRRSLIGSMLLLPIPAVLVLGDLGPLPGNTLAHTRWARGVRVVTDVTFEPIRAAALEVGQLVNAMPANFEELPEHGPERINDRAKSAVIVVRIPIDELRPPPGRENWDVDGILVYSKICTHVGCPISLYEQQTHNLLCPCHQSTFRLNEGGRVVFGPANRALPQLAIEVDAEGYLVAQGDFTEPVGPSFWERG
jgi:ubiquinol-cytochrome c reductase iron-sulfur subunit